MDIVNKVVEISYIRIRNGGIAQAFYELAKEEGCLTEEQAKELELLQSLPKDRIEIINSLSIKTNQ